MTTMTPTVLLAPSADLAKQVLSEKSVALTVEAEYGSYVAEGATYTAAHHQPAGTKYAGRHVASGGRPSPCNDPSIPLVGEGTILVSHVDLDTFGGCLRALGQSGLFLPGHQSFWDLAEFVDVRGPHKLGESGASEEDLRRLYAFWAWSKSPKGTPRFPRDSVTDVTAVVTEAGDVLADILHGDPRWLVAGDALKASEDDLNRRTFLRNDGAVIVRIAGFSRDFANHLYAGPDGKSAQAVACYNKENGSVTISLADPVPGVSCRVIVQSLWGPEAGGHDGIAGSPREKDMGEVGLLAAVRALQAALAPR